MVKKISKVLLSILIFLVVGFVIYRYNNKPMYNGILELKGLEKEVKVYFDEYGVPHIYAENQKDAYLAKGYLHAQDRLWQMELMRRIAAGRLSEIFGKEMVKTDKFFRALGVEFSADKTIKRLDTTSQAFLLTKSYLNGINQFIENGATPVEFRLIGVEKEKYTIKDIYNVFGYMAFGFAQAHKTDPLLTNLRNKLGDVYLRDLDVGLIPETTSISNTDGEIKSKLASSISSSITELLENVPIPPFVGSNSWVIGAKKTKNKKVIFANDPHIEFSQPSVWYLSHIVTPDYEMYGFNLALTPFPFMGHNRNYASGVTMFENDDIDFYENHQNQTYEIRTETINIKDEDPVNVEIKVGNNGPVMNGFIDIVASEKSVSMDWVYTRFNNESLELSYQMSHATSLTEFVSGAMKLHAPGLNFMYGDAKNNIAYFAAAKLITRSDGLNSKFFLGPESGAVENFNFVDFNKNPQAINPKSNYVYSANSQPQAIDGIVYAGYYLPEDRAKRIVNLLEPKNDFTSQDVETMLSDTKSPVIPSLITIIINELSKVNLSSNEKEAKKILEDWNGDYANVKVAPTIYTKFIYVLFKNTFHDEMEEENFQLFLDTHLFKRQIAKQIKNRKSIWWDDISTKSIKESRDEIITKAFHETVSALEIQFGDNIQKWTWNKALHVTHKHVFDKNNFLKGFFNVGPYETNGGNEVINNQIFKLNESGNYEVKGGPSTRRVIDFSDIENSVAILPTGQSGNVFSKHYKDQAQKYLNGEFVKMKLNKKEIELSEDKLILKPLKKEIN